MRTHVAYCLRHWKEFVLQKTTSHVSLADGGMRIDKERVAADDDFMMASARYIQAQTHGIQVRIREKKHFTLFDLLQACDSAPHLAHTDLRAVMCIPGNGILAALWHLMRKESEARAHIFFTHAIAAGQSHPILCDSLFSLQIEEATAIFRRSEGVILSLFAFGHQSRRTRYFRHLALG